MKCIYMDEGRFNKLVKRILKQSSKKFSLWVNVMRIFVNLVGIENLLKYVFFFFLCALCMVQFLMK